MYQEGLELGPGKKWVFKSSYMEKSEITSWQRKFGYLMQLNSSRLCGIKLNPVRLSKCTSSQSSLKITE